MLPASAFGAKLPKRGLMRRVHPLVKIVCALIIFIACISISKTASLLIYLLIMLGVLAASHLTRVACRILILFAPLTSIIAAVSWIGGNPLEMSLNSGMRVLFIAISIVMFAFTTTPAEFIRSLDERAPRSVTLGLMIVLRFVPVFIEEVRKIMQSMRLRGGKTKRGLRTYYRGFFVPLIYRIYALSDGIALGLHVRGFRLDGKRTKLHDLSFGKLDFAFLVFLIVISIGAVIA